MIFLLVVIILALEGAKRILLQITTNPFINDFATTATCK